MNRIRKKKVERVRDLAEKASEIVLEALEILTEADKMKNMNRTKEYRTYKSAFEGFNPFEGMTVEELENFEPACDEEIPMLREAWDELDCEIPARYYTYEKVRSGGRTFKDLTGWTYPKWKTA